MEHSFNVEHAKKYGVIPAVILKSFIFWIIKNKADERHFHDGRTWTFGSVKSFRKLFPYLSDKQIRSNIAKLIDLGVLLKGNYNKVTYDQTTWYALSDESILPFGQMELPNREIRYDHLGEPIPDSILDSKPDNIGIPQKLFDVEKKDKEPTIPKYEEFEKYAIEKKPRVDRERLRLKYEAWKENGWKTGNDRKIKNWKSTLLQTLPHIPEAKQDNSSTGNFFGV